MNELFTFKNLLKAYYDCRRNKRQTINTAKFEFNFEQELLRLERELKNKTYRPGRSICFAITGPKLREVFAADFRDRVAHHLLVNYLEPIFEPKFIDCSFACRKNKGALRAAQTLLAFLRRTTANSRKPAHYLQADISAFFTSLDRRVLYGIIERHVRNPEVLWLSERIIFHDPTSDYYAKGDLKLLNLIPPHKSLFTVPAGQGLPIGNLTSQFFANVYLNELDQFVKHRLKAEYYLRYVDDILLIHSDPTQLKSWNRRIDEFLHDRLKVRLQPDKQIIQSVYRGINFVGYIAKPGCLLVRNRTVRRLKNELWRFNQGMVRVNSGHPIRLWTSELKRDLQNIFASVNSYYGLFIHADTYRLRRHLYEKHFGILKTYLRPGDDKFSYFVWSDD